jgi:hypothetical protein
LQNVQISHVELSFYVLSNVVGSDKSVGSLF